MTLTERVADTRAALADLHPPQPADVRRPPGPSGRATMARLLTRRAALYEVFTDLSTRYGPVGYIPMAGEHLYVLSDPELIWQVFVGEARNTRKGRGLVMTRPVLGEGLLNSEGATHLRNRRLVQPAFHRRRIEGYSHDMVAAADDTSRRWRAMGGGAPIRVDLSDEMSRLTLDVVGRTLFGADLTGSATEIGTALDTVLRNFPRLMRPGGVALLRLPNPARRRLYRAIEDLDDVIARLIAERRADVAAGRPGGDILSLLLQARDPETGATLSDRQVRDETMTMVLAGHETTAMALSWALRDLTLSRTTTEWLRAEVDVRPADGMADVPGLARTYAVVAEGMRLHPPAWVISRNLAAPVRAGQWELPAGSTVLACQYAMHRDPRYWRSAEQYDPTRWLTADGTFDERAPGVPRGVWFPFGFGTRRCIGEQFAWVEAVLLLARLVRDWDIDVVAPQQVELMPAVTLRPRSGMRADVRPRRPVAPPVGAQTS